MRERDLFTTAINTIDYVNGIGNCSREQYVCVRDGYTLRAMIEVGGFVEFYVHWYFYIVTVSKEQ